LWARELNTLENHTQTNEGRISMSDDLSKVSDFEVSLLIIERDTCQYKKECIDELLNKIGNAKGLVDSEKPKQTPAKPEAAAVQEITFATLKFEAQQGAKLGEYEIAYKANNIEDKFVQAYNILRASNATIKDRYAGQGYQFSYWIYGEGKIYRQKLKPKA
jgi:hypothetical protein